MPGGAVAPRGVHTVPPLHPAESRRALADSAGVAAILLKCIGSHSSYLAANMTELAEMGADPGSTVSKLEPIFQSCTRLFGEMLKELPSTASYLKAGDYDNANISVRKAVDLQLACEGVTRGHEDEIAEDQVFYDMRVNRELVGDFMRIVDRL